jgi:hypothetical protein
MEILVVLIIFAAAAFMLRAAERPAQDDPSNSNNAPSRMTGWCATGYFAHLEEEGLLRGNKRHRPPEENGNIQ